MIKKNINEVFAIMKSFWKGIGIGFLLGLAVLTGLFLYMRLSGSEGPQTFPAGPATEPPEISADELSAPSPDDPPADQETTAPSPDDSSADQETASPSLDDSPADQETTALETPSTPSEVTLSFAGDVMFSEQYTTAYDAAGIASIADQEMLSLMQGADLFMINEEFPFSLRGEAMEDKQFTFRTDPKYVKIFLELGVDAVTVANNHALDFGRDAFCDTLDTLDQADIARVGGGYNITEASAPLIRTIGGQTFAIFAATRVSPSYDWYATDSQAGLFQTYDPARLNAAIKEADQNYDHVIVFVHWGIERNETPEEYQRGLAKGYIDAGADLIVGCHPHVLQGFEYYQGVPVIYSLGNYLFGNRPGETLLLNAVFSSDGDLKIQLIPCQRDGNGILKRIQDPSALYQKLTALSFDVKVNEDGTLSP